jgi:hypothetical protein
MNIYNNTQIFSTTIIRPIRKYYVKNHPFDSWYIGGILFMCTVMFVLLYANYYRENYCQMFWIRLLTKLRILPSLPSSSISPSLCRTNDPFVI